MEHGLRKLGRDQVNSLFEVLAAQGYELIGPRLADEAIVYDTIESAADLPQGWTDRHEPGSYLVERRDDEALFGYVVGPQSWKKFLHPPRRTLFKAERRDGKIHIGDPPDEPPKVAFIGVRACELHAIRIQDRVFLDGPHVDEDYKARRENAFIVAVNCTEARGTCFCVSMNTGPKVRRGYDISLTEVLEDGNHYFVIESGSPSGEAVLGELACETASNDETANAAAGIRRAAGQMGRKMTTAGLKTLLYDNYRHARWDEVAERCLSCANCTMVCPTCFCTTVEDVSDVTGQQAERVQRWDSCFNSDFSYLGGNVVRSETRHKYRQWMTHKLATWFDQFGTSGCVGCGRCITWCPVGIDITEEVAAIRASSQGD